MFKPIDSYLPYNPLARPIHKYGNGNYGFFAKQPTRGVRVGGGCLASQRAACRRGPTGSYSWYTFAAFHFRAVG